MSTQLAVREHYKMAEEGLWIAAVSSWEVVWGCCLGTERNCSFSMWEGHLDVPAGLISDREERLVDRWVCSCLAVLAAARLCAHGGSQLPATIKPFFVVLTCAVLCAGTTDVNQLPFCICITRLPPQGSGWCCCSSLCLVPVDRFWVFCQGNDCAQGATCESGFLRRDYHPLWEVVLLHIPVMHIFEIIPLLQHKK